jgi:hypothetical protein
MSRYFRGWNQLAGLVRRLGSFNLQFVLLNHLELRK